MTKEFLTEAKASTGPHAEKVFVCTFPPRWRGPRATWGRWSQKYRNIAQVPSPLHSQRFASSVEANNTTRLVSTGPKCCLRSCIFTRFKRDYSKVNLLVLALLHFGISLFQLKSSLSETPLVNTFIIFKRKSNVEKVTLEVFDHCKS